MFVQNRYLRFRLLVLLAGTAAAVLLAPSAGAKQTANWAKPQIKSVVAYGLMARSVNSFQPNALLTKPELTELLAALPTDAVVDPGSDTGDTTTTSTTTSSTTDPSHDTSTTTTTTTGTDPTHDPTTTGSTTTTTTKKKSGSPPGSVKPGA